MICPVPIRSIQCIGEWVNDSSFLYQAQRGANVGISLLIIFHTNDEGSLPI